MPSIRIENTGVRQALAELQARIGGLSEHTAKSIGEGIVNLVKTDLREKVSPWGDPRKPIKWRFGKRARPGDVPLLATRTHIFSRIAARAIPGGVEIGILDSENAQIGRTHQFGATIEREARKQTIHLRKVTAGKHKGKTLFASPTKHKRTRELEVSIRQHAIVIPARPYLPIRQDNTVDLPESWVNEIRALILKALK